MSLEPAKHSFAIYQGATFYKRITYKINGATQNLTGFSASLPIKDKASGTTLLTLDTSTNGGIVLGGSAGFIDLTIAAATTTSLTWDHAVYELFITDLTPRTDVLMVGGFKVIKF